MSARAVAAAIARALDRLDAQAADLPPDVIARREGGGVRLAGRGLLRRWGADARLWGFVPNARRVRR